MSLQRAVQRLPMRLWDSSRSFTTNASRAIPKVPLWINGEAVNSSSGGSVRVQHSKTREDSCELVTAGPAETEQIVENSWKAFESWRDVSGWERRKILGKVLTLLQERFPDFAAALRADVSMSDILIGADQRSAVNLTDGATNTAISTDGWIPPTIDGSLAMVLRQPYGPVLSIPAFNFPMTLALRSIVYPIACGNTVIMKSSIRIPQLHSLLGPLFDDAGLPKGVLQIVNYGEDIVVKGINQLIAHPNVRLVNFTGSTTVGRQIAIKCAEHLKPSILELGGKCAAIVLKSADLKLAANNIVFGAMFNSGQVCMSTERVLVDETVAEAFEYELLQAVKVLEENRQEEDGFHLVRPDAVDEIRKVVNGAIESGARKISGTSSNTSTANGTSISPIILRDIPPSSKAYQTEFFAPILSLSTFNTTTSAISQLHSLPLGLSTSIFGTLQEALPLARKIESGAVHINGMTIHDEHNLPFGGIKESGWGRFNGKGAIESFMWTKNITIQEGHILPIHAL